MIQEEALHDWINKETTKAITQIRQLVSSDELKQEAIIRLATEINVLERVKAKFHKEEK